MSDNPEHPNARDPRVFAIPDVHGHCKGEHKPYAEERPLPLTARMLFLWFYHACRRGWPRFMMVADHMNYLTFEDPAAVNLVRRALKLAQAGDLLGAAETANVDVAHASVVSEGLRRGMRFSIGAEVDNDPRARPDAQNIVDAMRPDGMIRSVHFLTITHPQHGENWNWPFDNPEFASLYDHVGTEKTWELYMAALLDAVERLPGHIVGHFYVPAKFGHWPDDATLERYEDQLLEKCAERQMAVEINTRFLYRGDDEAQRAKMLDAHRRLVRKAHERGVAIAVGADAHSPKDQAAGFETVLAILDEAGVNELAFPLGGRLARVALRVERKPEPEPEPEPAPPPPVAVAPDEAEAAQHVPTVRGDTAAPAAPKKGKKAKVPTVSAETTAPSAAPEDVAPPAAPPAEPPAQSPPAKKRPAKTVSVVADTAPVPAPAPAPAAVEPAPPATKAPAAAVKPATAKPVVAKEAAPAKPAPAKPEPAKRAPAKAAPVKAAPVKAAPVKAAPVKAAPVKAVPSKATATKATGKSATAKPAPKAPLKKAAAKPAARPAALKSVAKTVGAVAKAAVKAVGRATKPAAKLAVKAKPAAKATAKRPAVKPTAKAKPVPKSAAKPKATPKSKAPARPAKAKPAPKKAAARATSRAAAPKRKTAKRR